MRGRAELTLARSPDAARRARRFVDRICTDWRFPALCEDAETIASELVENTLQHTGSQPQLCLERRPDGLTISVSDDAPEHAYIRQADSYGGFGMLMVSKTAAEWGCTTAPAGGKTVWARLETALSCQ
ncbi:ATP-binding protein [Amycolatopsis sp. K13G38]|uniref:ATP-binding protein n=1 Tax=Amycolatopsis acididurans TaxID=2724524 RepID=A0ABX1JFH2_9PSEU|nr:ATP-binding protein [Amycolatopsis acididurans]NKQ57160.1 ATP-binding protein [Amycolatopsis acididurans]